MRLYKHILIPTDGSDVAEKAVAAGIEFARESDARVTLFTAVPEYQTPTECQVRSGKLVSFADFDRESEKKANAMLASATRAARAARLDFDTDFVQSDHPWQAIIDAAKRRGCDAIFMGSHGHKGLAAVWHSSQTREVLTHSTVPTLVYR
jgi:nucleotide-binding universal stress UspA family protein